MYHLRRLFKDLTTAQSFLMIFMFGAENWWWYNLQLRDLEMEKRDPRTAVAVILGGGAGTRLFPLTKRRAKPAVRI